MSYVEIVKKYEPQIGKKFTYEQAIEFWNALDEPYKLQLTHHLKCADHSEIVTSAENCKVSTSLLIPMDNSKKTALSFFNKTLNNPALFPKESKDKLLKSVRNTLLFKKIEGQVGGYYEKYMKYKQKYLALKAELEGGDIVKECAGKDWNYLMQINIKSTNLLIDELENKLTNHNYISLEEVHTYLSGMEAFYARHHSCTDINKSFTEAQCSHALDKIKNLYQKFIKAMRYSYKNIDDEAKKYALNLYTYSKH
jgi:hypothetical protein